MKVALINPPPRTEYERHWARFPVLGLAYVASALRAAGHTVELLDGKLAGLTLEEILNRVDASAPDLIGVTCMTVEFPAAARLAKLLKQRRAATPIVVGGAHVNAVKTQVLEECPAFDFACVDEGELLIRELVAALEKRTDLAAIRGLAWRQGGEIVFNGQRSYPPDYDALPFPAWDLFAVGEQIPLLTHRGCPFQCNFCGHNSGFKPRYRTPENVLAEIDDIVARFHPKVIRFEDETFGLNLPRTKAILHGILQRGLQKSVRFSAQTRVDRTDEDFIRLLKDCNFETLEIGVESGNADVLRRVQKGITLEQVERAVKFAKAAKIRVWCKFILGHPNETRQEMMDTINFIARVNPDQLSVSIMTPFPGTPIFDMAVRGEGGYRLLSGNWGDFDKYASGVLELDTVSLGGMKALQLAAYLKLYVVNGRFRDLASIVGHHRRMAIEMLVDTVGSLVRGRRDAVPESDRPTPVALGDEWFESGAARRRPPQPMAARPPKPARPGRASLPVMPG